MYSCGKQLPRLGYRTPVEYAAAVAARPASPPTPVVSIRTERATKDVQETQSVYL